MSNGDYSVLMPPPQLEGGLIKMPKKNPDANSHEFKIPLPVDSKPKGSLLGLDLLAAKKKKEKLENEEKSKDEEPTSKRSKVFSYKTDEEESVESDSKSGKDHDSRERDRRHYRERDYDDKKTPTPHRTYHDRIDRNDKYNKKGVYASTSKYDKRDRRDKKRSWEEVTPTNSYGSDYIKTPKGLVKDTPSRSSWKDEEDRDYKKRFLFIFLIYSNN